MKKVRIQVQNDHLERMTKVKKPILAIAELIWNAFDADSEKVTVRFYNNPLGGIDTIEVSDNGHGITYEDAESCFGSLGGSWKQYSGRSKQKGRLLHGRAGKGRFRSFCLGELVKWRTTYRENGTTFSYEIKGHYGDLGTFLLSDKKTVSNDSIGTIVSISNIQRQFKTIRGQNAAQDITEQFALYLNEYPDTKIVFDDQEIDPEKIKICESIYDLSVVKDNEGNIHSCSLTIIEWSIQSVRALFLCDKNGFTLERTVPGIKAPGFNFTAYIKSDFIRVLEKENLLALQDMVPELRDVLSEAKETMKNHFREKEAVRAEELVQSWKEQEIYPYVGKPTSFIEETERQVFDICALNINEYLPNFNDFDPKSKKLSFQLIKQSIAENPKALRKILADVLDLPPEKQDDLAELLEKTTLSAIVNASKTVTDRLDFLKGLDLILFEKESKERLLERSQLHRILADHTWIFGEEFNLSADDESLTAVLKKHLALLGKDRQDLAPVTQLDGKKGIVDLMLSRIIPQPKAEKREHLIVELKRPKQKIGVAEASQIKGYAFAVSGDERFKDTDTKWHVIAVSNEIDETIKKEASQKNRPLGLLYDDPEGKVYVWVKTWGQILQDSNGRLRFYQEKLQYNATLASGLDYLKKTHEKYLPKHMK